MATTRLRPTRVARLARTGLLAVLLLVLLLHAVGGWYLSGRIRDDVLEVRAYPVERHLTLGDVTERTVRVSSSDPAEVAMVQAPSTYGIRWDTGYGRISGRVLARDGAAAVRRFELVTGEAPTEGTRAELDLVAFPQDPALALGPRVREVAVTSPLGRFPAYLAPGSRAGTWAVLVHGKGGSRAEMFRMARSTQAAGLTSMSVTYRNDQGLPRDPSGFYGYGRTEWRELDAAVAWAGRHGARRVVLGADSMGGAIVASYLDHRARDPEPGTGAPAVVGLVLDSPLLDLGATVRYGARQISLPVLGPTPDTLTWAAERLATARFALRWDEVDHLADTAWLQVPCLVVHGTEDTTVPISTSRALARARPEEVTLVEVEGAEHVRSWNADPGAYTTAVADLVARATR